MCPRLSCRPVRNSKLRSVRRGPINHSVTSSTVCLPITQVVHRRSPNVIVFQQNSVPFGWSLAPAAFSFFSGALRHLLVSMGVPELVCYLDDFLIVAATQEASFSARSSGICSINAYANAPMNASPAPVVSTMSSG